MPPMPQLSQVEAQQYKEAGNEFRRLRLYDQSLQAYEAAIRTNPGYADAYFNLAQLLTSLGNLPRAIQTLTQLLTVAPGDHDARVTLGEYYEKMGNTQEAKKRYMEVLQVKPDFDPARRRLDYLLYLDQKRFLPDTADALLKTRYTEVLHKARELLKDCFTRYHPNPVLLKLSQEVPVVFEETQTVGNTQDIAEYDHPRGVIRIQPQLLFSTHSIVAAYLAHELTHALDGDGQTSIMEEQDGYRELARFWSVYQGAENEPNLDRALSLYRKSQDALDQEVRRVYAIRDAGIPDKSPGHGLPSNSPLVRAADVYENLTKLYTVGQFRNLFQKSPPLGARAGT